MPPKKNAAEDAGAEAPAHGYTDGEIQLMIAIIKQVPRPANLDAERIAAEIGSASGGSVRKRISNAVAKHGWFGGGAASTAPECDAGDGSAAPPGKKPRVKRAPKNKKTADDDDGEGDDQEKPKKKARTTKTKGKSKVKTEAEAGEDAADDADGEEVQGQI